MLRFPIKRSSLNLKVSSNSADLNVVDDQIGGPTPADKIAEALLTMAGAMMTGKSGGVFHFSGTPNVSWADFAREIFAQSGDAVSVNGIPTTDFPTPAKRPLNSRLDCSKIKDRMGKAMLVHNQIFLWSASGIERYNNRIGRIKALQIIHPIT